MTPFFFFRRFLTFSLVVGLGSFLAVGCSGGKTGTVSGKVTLDGKPVNNGVVTFTLADGKNRGSAAIQENGTFTIEKVPQGAGTFTVDTGEMRNALEMEKRLGQGGPDGSPPAGGDSRFNQMAEKAKKAQNAVLVPTSYANPQTSGLTYTVKAGKQEHDLPLTGQQ